MSEFDCSLDSCSGHRKCSYTKVHADAGTYNNTASVTVHDNENNQKTDTANDSVTVTDVKPTFLLAKTVDLASRPGTQCDLHLYAEDYQYLGGKCHHQEHHR